MNASSTYHFDVALSFASENRDYVSQVASELKSQGIRVFYDEFYNTEAWGTYLDKELENVYSRYSRWAVLFISKHYALKKYTNLEREAAEARALREKGEYILRLRFGNSDFVTGPTDDLDISGMTPQELSEKIAKKIRDVEANTSAKKVSSEIISAGKIKSSYYLMRSPMIGTILFSNGYSIQPLDWDGGIASDFQFYGDQPRFINVGDRVKRWQTIFKIASMGYANEIETNVDGTVMEFLVEDGQTVEWEQPIMKILPAR